MITSLYIKNIAVIKELNTDFHTGFSVLTGETGAGKSVIMDCIGILIGVRSLRGKIRHGEREAIIRASFSELSDRVLKKLEELGFDADGEIILQRSFTAEGKSQVRLNGQVITQAIAKEIGSLLIAIHGQNDNQRLMQRSEHLEILDSYADLGAMREDYQTSYNEYRMLQQKLSELRERAREKERLYDVYLFQAKEIDDINPKCGEEEFLLAEEKRLENIEKIQKHTQFTYHVLSGADRSAFALIDKASSSLSQLESVIDGVSEINERLVSIEYELEEISDIVRAWGEDDGENAEKKLDKIGSRLNSISKLKRKYGSSIEEILEFRRKLADKLDEMENSDDLISLIESKLDDTYKVLEEKGENLRNSRKIAADKLQSRIMSELEFLEMPKVKFVINIKPADQPTSNGLDDIEFLISTNAGQPPMPMIKIASGGELSRIMLAIQSILLDKYGVSTVIFDEIDTGISGKTSRKVGIKLKQISTYIQVICVTHSAQIASLSDNHYLISKRDINEKTQTSVELIDDASRIGEIARILGGLNVTDNQVLSAVEMIEEGKTL